LNHVGDFTHHDLVLAFALLGKSGHAGNELDEENFLPEYEQVSESLDLSDVTERTNLRGHVKAWLRQFVSQLGHIGDHVLDNLDHQNSVVTFSCQRSM